MMLEVALFLGALVGAENPVGAQLDRVGELRVQFDSPEMFIPGESFIVSVELLAVGGAVEIESWYLTPSIFAVDGEPVGSRADEHAILLNEEDAFEMHFDLGRHIHRSADSAGKFELDCTGDDAAAVEVAVHIRAPEGLDFFSLPVERLTDYRVFMRTNRGDMLHEMWPQFAPNHVRNFLDLAYTGFYDGTIFHRVMAGFMIQGGDPTGTGGGNGPRMLQPEFSQEKHLRGVLSMARTNDPASASCQFFVMHGEAPGLDGQYSIFGRLLVGYETLDAIVSAPGKYISQSGDIRPAENQVIERAVVVLAN